MIDCLRQMGYSDWLYGGHFCTILAVLWQKETWFTMAFASIQSKKWSKSAKNRLKEMVPLP